MHGFKEAFLRKLKEAYFVQLLLDLETIISHSAQFKHTLFFQKVAIYLKLKRRHDL